jgi:hypothetical protein
MSEEAKLRAKYGSALPRQQNMLTKKLLSKVKYYLNHHFKEFLRFFSAKIFRFR